MKKETKSEKATPANRFSAANILEMLGGASRIDEVQDRLNKAIAKLGHVNLIIAGKTGAGKSTLVNSVFRDNLAKTDAGKPVTDKMEMYEREGVPLRIYDTVGLELDMNAQFQTIREINELIQKQRATHDEREYIHGIWYCFNAGAARVEPFELDFIRKLSSEVPVIAVITRATRAKIPFKNEFKQRKKDADAMKKFLDDELSSLSRYQGCYIVLAQKEDGERPFGLEELTLATARMIPDGAKRAFTNAQKILIDQKVQTSYAIINRYTATAAAIGAAPIPGSDAPLLASAEIAMCAHVTAAFGVDLDKGAIASVVMSLAGVSGVTMAGKFVVSNLLKLVPVAGAIAGGIISGTTAAILMEALGRTYVAVLRMIAEGEKQEADLTTKPFEDELKKMMKKELKNISAELKKRTKDKSGHDAPPIEAFSETSTEILQDLADLS